MLIGGVGHGFVEVGGRFSGPGEKAGFARGFSSEVGDWVDTEGV